MKFQVIGQNRDTGARMTLEFEAESKGAAERKANNQGMAVHRVVDITDGHPPMSHDPNPRAGAAHHAGGGRLKLILIVAIIAVLVWYFYPTIIKRL
jgi:hypothetical protein